MYSCPICEKNPPTASLLSCLKRMARALEEKSRQGVRRSQWATPPTHRVSCSEQRQLLLKPSNCYQTIKHNQKSL